MAEWHYGIGSTYLIPARLHSSQPTPERGQRLYFAPHYNGRINVNTATGQSVAEVLEERSILSLRHLLETSRDYIAEVDRVVPAENQVQLRVSQPTDVITIPGILQVVISNRLRQRITNLGRKELQDTELDLNKWLDDQFIWHSNYLVFTHQPEQPDHVTLFSPLLRLECEVHQETFLRVTKAYMFKRKEQETTLQQANLMMGQVVWLQTESDVPEVVQGALSLLQVAQSRSDYFDIWEKYRALELETTVEIVKTLPQLTYHQLKYYPEVVRFYLDKNSLTEQWTEYSGSLSVELVIPPRAKSEPDDRQPVRTVALGTVRRLESDFLDVDRPDDEFGLPSRGQLQASAIGDAVRLTRQTAALERLQTGSNPIPHLDRLLATGQTDEIRTYPVAGFKGNPPHMADGRAPNPRQQRAVEMALNTPDICVIQGPPGTGKTTVIRTIIRRLKDEGRRQLLISSHQHTAVDKAIDGLQVCGVVSYRYGGNQTTETYRSSEIEEWVTEVSQNVEVKLKQLSGDDNLHKKLLTLRKLLDTVVTQPEPKTLAQLLVSIPRDYQELLPSVLSGQAERLHLQLETLLTTVRHSSTSSNNPRKLVELLYQLPEIINPDNDLPILKRLKPELERLSRGNPENYSLVKQYQKHLIEADKWDARSRFGDNQQDAQQNLHHEIQAARKIITDFSTKYAIPASDEGQSLTDTESYRAWQQKFQVWCRNVGEAMEQQITAGKEYIPTILQQWLSDLRTRPGKVEALFRKHADVWGVTCQQTVAQRFGLYDEAFDCVIVDEAARTSPLDLIIPLTRARRIILVGDHLQLPHMLEYRLEKEFAAAAEGQDTYINLLKESLFKRLYQQLPVSKKIRLNRQYRMNPKISRLVSELFYADDPLVDEDSTQDLINDTPLFTGQSLVWLDVTPKDGQKLETGQFYNPAEIKQVVNCVDQLIKSKTTYSLGIITYYAQQRDQIERVLRDRGVGSAQIQVGSVDAFQGEEKDIILLSMVRSNPHKLIGFLKPNRINVSLSRARRLLVIVADSQTVTTSPDLKKAYEYCQVHGVISKVQTT